MWVATKVPQMGMLIAQRNYVALDRLFLKACLTSLGVVSLGTCVMWTGVYLLYSIGHPLATRLLPPLPAGLLLLATIFSTAMWDMSAYLRAHKREPYVSTYVIGGVLTGLSTVLLGSRFGATGMMAGYLGVMVLLMIPNVSIFFRCRSRWHSGSASAAAEVSSYHNGECVVFLG